MGEDEVYVPPWDEEDYDVSTDWDSLTDDDDALGLEDLFPDDMLEGPSVGLDE